MWNDFGPLKFDNFTPDKRFRIAYHALLTLHMAVGALESVTTTSGHLIWDSLELGACRPVTAAPGSRNHSQLALQISSSHTQAIQNALPVFREMFVSGQHEDVEAGQHFLSGRRLRGLLLGSGRHPGGGGGWIGQKTPECTELPFIIPGLLHILLKQHAEARWQEVCSL